MAEQPRVGSSEEKGRNQAFIKKAFGDSGGTYGYWRVHAQLRRWGVECGDELVRALMRELGLVPRPGREPVSVQRHHRLGVGPMLSSLRATVTATTAAANSLRRS